METWMQGRNAAQVMMREHRQLTTVIAGMKHFFRLKEAGAGAPGLMVFRAMLYYIREYPDQVHHPKEDRHLFTRLRERTPDLDEVISELESEHAQGDARLRNIEHAFVKYELEGPPALPALREMVEEYASFYQHHRRVEEEIILPAALKYLTRSDWCELDEAFGANRDPFEGEKLDSDFDRLFEMIETTIPESNA
jgi:hemerythrin-like domain-containing protein